MLYIVVDDMGFADVGCFGNKSLATLNVDCLWKEGIKLTHHLSAYPLCTPSRVSAITGRSILQHLTKHCEGLSHV